MSPPCARPLPTALVELATALQDAFYVDGRSLSEAATYRARRRGRRARRRCSRAVVTAFEAPEAQAAAEADFRRAAQLGVTGFPTLLAVDGDSVTPLARGHATADEVDRTPRVHRSS